MWELALSRTCCALEGVTGAGMPWGCEQGIAQGPWMVSPLNLLVQQFATQ